MATPQPGHPGPESTLQVRRTFAVPRERMFAAWTEPAQLAKWMCRASPQNKAEYLELDVRAGGRYRMRNTSPNGDVYLLRGEYREIHPPEKLSFTWQWEKTPAAGPLTELGETLVTVEFFERGKETEVVLTHSGFTSAEIRDRHSHGWNGCFDTLAAIL
jgi:uncharacterized protein YndB with AHSA1/START domain